METKEKLKFKIWTAANSKANDPGLMVGPDNVGMIGSKKSYVIADKRNVYIGGGGSVSFNTTSENMRKGGLFIEMNDFVRMIPSTVVTPIPPQIPFPPLALAGTIVSAVALFGAALALTREE